MNLANIAERTVPIVKEAAQFIQSESLKFTAADIHDKSLNQLVSYVDIEAEKLLVKGLQELLPEAGFITEESTIMQGENNTYQWVIDPLDGTTNFLHKLPVYGVSVGLIYKGDPVMGCIYDPNRDELFLAWKDGGAYLNGQKMVVKASASLAESLIATGFPYYEFDKMQAYLSVLDHLMKNSRGLRRMGSAAIDLAYTACGRFDAFFEYNLSSWDVAAGICIAQEAGALVSDFRGGKDALFGKEIIAASPALHASLVGLLTDKFYP